jgi:YadA head domain repeat (2 copies)
VALGQGATSSGNASTAVGFAARAFGNDSVAVGDSPV